MANLVAPITPTGENPVVLEAIQRGFAGLAANRRHAEDVQLNLQKLALDEQQSQRDYQLKQDQLSQQQPLIDAHARYYKALGDAATTKNMTDTEDLASAAQDVRDLTKSGAIPGTSKYQTGLMDIYNNHMTSLGTLVGQRMWRPLWKNHELAGKTAWTGFRAANANYLNDLKANGLSEYAFQNPDVWADTPDGKAKELVIRSNGEVLVPTEENKNLANQKDPATQTPLATIKTLQKPVFESWLKKHENYQKRQDPDNMPAVNPFTGMGYDNLPAPVRTPEPGMNQGAMQSQSDLALKWAKEHPDDPRAAAIKQRLGVQ